MLLSETITNGINAINEKRAAQDRKKSIEEFSTALANLNTVCSQLGTVTTCMKELKKLGIISTPVMASTTRDDLLSSVYDCGSGIEDGSLSKDTVKIFTSHVNTAKAELNNAWASNASVYSDGPRGYISMIAGLTDDPKKTRELEHTIQKIASGAISLKQINDLVSSVSAANELMACFSLEPQIQIFLQKVSSEQATVADLTPAVQEWLKEKILMEKLKISF